MYLESTNDSKAEVEEVCFKQLKKSWKKNGREMGEYFQVSQSAQGVK